MNTVFVVFAAVFMRALEFLLTSSTTTLRLINCPHDIPSRPPGATTELSTAEERGVDGDDEDGGGVIASRAVHF